MIRPFDGLTGSTLEHWFRDLFLLHLHFKYFPSPGQISLHDIDPSQSRGQHLEIDGIILIHKTCILVECTSQGDAFKKKIQKFVRNCNLFINSPLSLKERFSLFNVPEEEMDNFEDVEHYKFLYIGTNNIFENADLSRADFPDYQAIQKHLFIFKPTQVEYLRQLTNLINVHAKNDFLAALGFSPADLGDKVGSISLDFIKADGKYIASDTEIRADIYLIKFNVKELLEIARVSRYEGIPFILDEDGTPGYQRFLIEQKLGNISSTFIQNNARKCFPNTITLVLPSSAKEEDVDGQLKLSILKKYSSIDIIDGQHRLFAYTRPTITDDIRGNSEILASAIRFKKKDNTLITRNSAKIFCEINSNQAKVKNNLIYLIKYDVLGDVDEVAVAGKIVLECNKGTSSLSDIFFTNTLRKRNRLNLAAVPVTTIIDNDLVPFLKGTVDNQLVSDAIYSKTFGHSRTYFQKGKQAELVTVCKALLERYFNQIAKVFDHDWTKNSTSYLISSKYISAFVRLLRHKMLKENVTIAGMEQVLKDMKTEVDKITSPKKSPSFPKGETAIPSTKHGINTIFEFLLDPESYESDQ